MVIPNGSILEFGAVYQTARLAGHTAVTFEFGEQRERMWIAQNAEAMRLGTDALWTARKDVALTENDQRRLEAVHQARKSADPWGTFARQWQAERKSRRAGRCPAARA